MSSCISLRLHSQPLSFHHHLLCKLVTEVLDVEDMRSSLALVLPFVTISIKDTIAKQVVHRTMEIGSFDVVFKVTFDRVDITRRLAQYTHGWVVSYLLFRTCSTF